MPKPPRRRRPFSNVYKDYLQAREIGVLGHRASNFLDSNPLIHRNYRNMLKSISSEESHLFPNVFDQSENGFSLPSGGVGITGGIYNLEFNPEGSLLAAACEKKTVLLFDPNTRKPINVIENAHTDCVNCVRFLDTRSFATCSDDTTVALWDARYLKYKVRSLKGHSNWIKNIEYSFKENLLVTSGFDGAIFTWDINKYSERGDEYSKVFNLNGLMRMRLTPDANQMIVSTMNGYMLIIHDLSLANLKKDLDGFKPNLYRLLQVSGRPIPEALNYTHLFHSSRNRTEIISDFAPNNDAEMISSLQVHPQGWVVVSRNISSDNRSEWCCVHDIHPYPTDPRNDDVVTSQPSSNGLEAASDTLFSRLSSFMPGSFPNEPINPHVISINVRTRRVSSEGEQIQHEHELEQQPQRREMGFPLDRLSVLRMIEDIHNNRPSSDSPDQDGEIGSRILFISPGNNQILYLGSPASLVRNTTPATMPKNPRLHRNLKRLTHYIEESNTGRGLIKEVSFSSDGRVICSPFGFGIRLLSFDSRCNELNRCLSNEQRMLTEIGTVTGRHDEVVLSSAFSPNQYMLVSGCHAGKISWYQPVL